MRRSSRLLRCCRVSATLSGRRRDGLYAASWTISLALLAMPALVLAQEQAENPLDEIVVTATRLQTTVWEAARSVSVVDQQAIQNGMQQLALDESLAGVPGLYMQNRYNMAQDLRISLRGFGARSAFGIRGIKIIVDGIPETLPDGFDYLVNLASQELNGYREHSAAKGTVLNGRFGVELSGDDSLTFVLNSTDQPRAQDAGGISATQVALDRRSARAANLVYDAGEALDQQRFGVVYKRDRAAGSLMIRNYYVWRDFSNYLPFETGGAVDLDRFFYGFGAQYTFADVLPAGWELLTGFDIDRQNDTRKRFDNLQGVAGPLSFDQLEKADGNGVFVQGRYQFNRRWNMTAGLRYDTIRFEASDRYLVDGNDSGRASFGEPSYSLGLNRKLGSGVLFANIGNSFETPTTTELANPDGSGGFNPSLQAQTAVNYEVGFKTGTQQLYSEIAAFHIDLEGELVPYELPGSPGRTFYTNAGKSTRRGIETAVAWRGSSGLGLDASLTWSGFRFDRFVDESGADYSGSRLPGVPEYFAFASFNYKNSGGFNAAFETLYSGSLFADNANGVSVPDYVVAALRATYDIQTAKLLLRPYVGINNLFNEKYNSNIRINSFGGRYYEPAPERNVYAGIVIRYTSASPR